jgi:hypothetical protein
MPQANRDARLAAIRANVAVGQRLPFDVCVKPVRAPC